MYILWVFIFFQGVKVIETGWEKCFDKDNEVEMAVGGQSPERWGLAGQIKTVCIRCDYTSSLLEKHPLSIKHFQLSQNPHKMLWVKKM